MNIELQLPKKAFFGKWIYHEF